MSFTELKEKVVELSAEDRFKLSAFLADLEQEREMEFRNLADKRMKAMDAGAKMDMADFEERDRKLRKHGK
jgi:hypothetical protein